jgi:hypothetical protein
LTLLPLLKEPLVGGELPLQTLLLPERIEDLGARKRLWLPI